MPLKVNNFPVIKTIFKILLKEHLIFGGKFAMYETIAHVVCFPVFVKAAPSMKSNKEMLFRANCLELYENDLQTSEIFLKFKSNLNSIISFQYLFKISFKSS